MSCHEDNRGSQGIHKHSPLKHMLHMILCCGLPIVIIGFLPLITKFSPSAGSVIGRIVPFLCPLMMLSMIPMMFGGNRKESCCDDEKKNLDNNRSIELNKPVE
ncbi:hypothetical protein [Candidatus Clostridium radicumherbarum]|uniref:DUF2933 domain-containing protein n=1 Tax=Candidatus Clostridium radicumherbarum TaxID=3381662 RepID=A0ABW8TLW1_9CLOT